MQVFRLALFGCTLLQESPVPLLPPSMFGNNGFVFLQTMIWKSHFVLSLMVSNSFYLFITFQDANMETTSHGVRNWQVSSVVTTTTRRSVANNVHNTQQQVCKDS